LIVIVEIEGTDLPGRRCGPNPEGEMYENIHVGIGDRRDPIELVPGDARSARWRVEVTTHRASDGSIDFRGPFVEGKRGDRFLYLNWGSVASDGSFKLFRRAKLSLSEIDPTLVDRVLQNDGVLACTLTLTDTKGHPRCARVRAPDIAWRASPNGLSGRP
jgi:hypothetical protein